MAPISGYAALLKSPICASNARLKAGRGISLEEYRRLRRRDRRVLRAEDFTDADIAAIASAEMEPRHRQLDDELE